MRGRAGGCGSIPAAPRSLLAALTQHLTFDPSPASDAQHSQHALPSSPLYFFVCFFWRHADAIIMDDVEKMAKMTKKQASLFNKALKSPASAQVGGGGHGCGVVAGMGGEGRGPGPAWRGAGGGGGGLLLQRQQRATLELH